MAYSAVPTYVTGDLFSAANANTYWKDNFAASVPDIFTAAGDIPYATAADAASPLAIGTARQGLFVNAGATAPEWDGGLFGCHISVTTDVVVAADSTGKLSFDTENYDTDALWSTDNTDAITIPWDGVYMCNGVIRCSAGQINAWIDIGAANVWYSIDSASTNEETMNFTYINRFAQNDDVYINIRTVTFGMTITSADYSVTYLGAST